MDTSSARSQRAIGLRQLKAVGRIFGGSISGYAIAFALTVYMTRLYTPAQFGAYTTFSGFVAIASIFATGCMELAIMNARSKSAALRFAMLTIAISTVLVFTVSIIALPLLAIESVGVSEYLLCAASVLVAAYANTAIIYSIFIGREKTAGLLYMLNTAGRAVSQCAVAPLFAVGNLGLMVGDLISRLLQIGVYPFSIFVVKGLLRNFRAFIYMVHNKNKIVLNYFFYVMPANLLDTTAIWILPMGFTILYGIEEGGYFSFVHRISYMIISLANNSIANVFHREICLIREYGDNKKLYRILLFIIISTVILCISSIFILEFIGKQFITIVFGGKWLPMLSYSIFWQPPFFATLLSLFANRIALVLNYNKLKLYFSAGNIVIILGSFIIMKLAGSDPEQGFNIMAVSVSIAPLTFYGFLFFKLKVSNR